MSWLSWNGITKLAVGIRSSTLLTLLFSWWLVIVIDRKLEPEILSQKQNTKLLNRRRPTTEIRNPKNKNEVQFLNSLLKENGDLAPYEIPAEDLQDMVKSVSHGTGGDKNVIVQARFLTAGSDGTPGKSVASFEAYNGVPCDSTCTNGEIEKFEDGIERYSKTVTTTATKYTGELPQ